MKTKLIIMAMAVFTLFSCNNTNQKSVDKTSQTDSTKAIYFGGDIITVEGDKPEYAEAVVRQNDKIVFVGKKDEALKQYPNAVQFNLKGKTMVPAFLDGHSHMYFVGFTSLCANLLPPPDGPCNNTEIIVETLNKYKNSEEGKSMFKKLGWIIGNGYDDSQLASKKHPTTADLDKVSTEFPVIILHQSGHIGVMNTKGLETVGYTAKTKNPEGGVIRKDENGNPTGVVEEAAFFKVLAGIVGKVDAELALKCIDKGQEKYAKFGYLTAQDGRTTKEQLTAFEAAADNHKLFIDVVAYPDITIGTDFITSGDYKPSHEYKNNFRIGGVKLTLDGSPQGKTAWLTQPYLVPPTGQKKGYKGYPVMTDKQATGYVKTAFKNKWQILCHTNGDAAIDQFIKALDVVEKKYNYPDSRSVLVHGQTLRKDQIPELVRLGIYPSLFPMHTFYWGDWYVESVLGEPRANYISPCRDVLDAGLTITSHTDAPVTFPNSMRVYDATVNRITRSGKILGPDQRLTAYEGLETLTKWGAKQYFEENSKGTLTVGKLADFVILDKNPLKIDPLKINTIKILESIKGGKTVYKNK